MLFVSRYTRRCGWPYDWPDTVYSQCSAKIWFYVFPVRVKEAEVDVVTDSCDVTLVSDDGCRTEAHKWSGLAVFIFAIQACVMIILESSQAQLVVHNPVLWSLHHIAPPRYPFILKMPAHLAAPFPMTLGGDWPLLFISRQWCWPWCRDCALFTRSILYLHGLYLCSHGDKPTFSRLLLWAVTKPSKFGPWWALTFN